MTDRYLLILAVFLLVLAGLSAQDNPTGEETAEDDTTQEAEVDTRRLTLLYGIDSEVLTVLADLRSDSLATYNDLLLGVMADSRNSEIAREIYALWSATEWDGGLEMAAAEISNVLEDEDYETTVVQAAIAYIADRRYSEVLPELGEIAAGRDTKMAASAVRAIGKIGDAEAGAMIGEGLLERLIKEDPNTEDDLVASIIVTLGALEYEPAAAELVAIMEDEGASDGHRRLACVSIGQIGREGDYELVERLYYESSDATLRSYALAGLAEYTDRDTTGILIQALKRDSFWRIRLTAAEKLGENGASEAAELLRYKAEYDPVNQVKIASMTALGRLGDNTSRIFLIDTYTDDGRGTEVRLAALSVLVDNRLRGTDDAVMSVMDELWEKDRGRFLEFTCRDLSRADWPALSGVYERMLDHSNWLMQVYGIRGIRRNSLAGLYGKVNALDAEGVDGKVRREVTSGS